MFTQGLRKQSQDPNDGRVTFALEGLDTWVTSEGGTLGGDYLNGVTLHVNSVCQRTFDVFASDLSQYMDGLVDRSGSV